MKLLLVSGFLGSGKTTLVLAVARTLVDDGASVAIVENEIGEIGIDGAYLAQEGLTVRELFGGCICCTLTAGLVDTLRELEATQRPDWAIVEPTGLAWPADLLAAVSSYLPQIETARVLTVVDTERWDSLVEVVAPLVGAQIAAADVIAVNKIDLAAPGEGRRVARAISAMNPGAAVVMTAASEGGNVDAVLRAVL